MFVEGVPAVRPGTRPAKEILIEFQIRLKYIWIYLLSHQSNHTFQDSTTVLECAKFLCD